MSNTADISTGCVKIENWMGFPLYRFEIAGFQALIVMPRELQPGNPWVWGMEFPFAFHERTGVIPIIERGFAYMHISVGNTFAYDGALDAFETFHAEMARRGFARKCALIGISRGGLYSCRFAERFPEAVTCIYNDAPVCDITSWPAGFGEGKGSPGDWESLKKLYGFASDDEARAFKGNPLDFAGKIARAGIPMLIVSGTLDEVVPWKENGEGFAENFIAASGSVEVYRKVPDQAIQGEDEQKDSNDTHVIRCSPDRCGHHPHGLRDCAPQVAFISKYNKPA